MAFHWDCHWEFHVLGRSFQGQHARFSLLNVTQWAPNGVLFCGSFLSGRMGMSCQSAAVRVDTMCVPCGALYSKTRQMHSQLDIGSVIWKSWITFWTSLLFPGEETCICSCFVFTLILRKEWIVLWLVFYFKCPAEQLLCMWRLLHTMLCILRIFFKQRIYYMCKWLVFPPRIAVDEPGRHTGTVALLCRWWFDAGDWIPVRAQVQEATALGELKGLFW